MYDMSASDVTRPRQCVPLACVKFVCAQPSAVAATVSHSGTLTELRQPAAASTSQTHISRSHSVPQSSANTTCSSSVSIASGSRSSAPSPQCPTTNSVRQSAALSAAVQHSQCHATDVSATAAATVGLASAVWTPMGATLQQIPQQRADEAVQPISDAEQQRLIGVHHRLTISFNEEFSQNMNAIIKVMLEACKVLTSAVFQFTLEKLRLLRRKYCELTDICVAYGKFQKTVRCDQSVMLPAVSCLHSSIEILMDSVNTVTAVFREMHQWLSADTGMTVTERGLGLSNRVCHFVPVFLREMDNFKRSLLMIVPDTASVQSTGNATVVPSNLSSGLSYVESSGSTHESIVSPVVAPWQQNENVELQGQYVEPIFVAPIPIVIEPDGLPDDDELGLISVKQEPVEINRKRHRTHTELVYVNDDEDGYTVSDATKSAVDEADEVAFTLASCKFNGDNSLSLKHDLNASASDHHHDSQPTSAELCGMSSSYGNEAVSPATVHHTSINICNSVNEWIELDMLGDTGDNDTGLSFSPVKRECTGTVQPASATCSLPATCLESIICPNSSQSIVSRSITTVAVTDDSCADQLSSFINVNCSSSKLPAFSGDQGLDVSSASATSMKACIAGSLADVTGEVNDMHGSKVTVSSCDKMNCEWRNVNKSPDDRHGRHSVTSAEQCSVWSTNAQSESELDHCLRNFCIDRQTADSNTKCNSREVFGDTPGKHTVSSAANNNGDESAPVKVPNGGEHDNSNTVVDSARCDALDSHSNVDNLCTITSVCSIELDDFIDATDDTTVDDIVTALRAFDKNANIAFDKGDLCCHDFHAQFSEPSHSLPVKTVQKKKKRVPASRFARKKKKKQQSKAFSGSESDTYAASVSENVEHVDESNNCEETLHSEHDKETVDSDIVTDKPVSSGNEKVPNKVAAHQETNVEEALLKSTTDDKHLLLDSGCDTQPQPLTEKQPPKADVAENTCSSSVHLVQSDNNESSVSKTVVDTTDVDNSCEKATALKSKGQKSSLRRQSDVMEEKCSKQPESECRDEADSLLDDNQLHIPGKKKRARVIYEEEDVENVVSPTSISVNGRNVKCKTRTSRLANDTKKVKKFKSGSAKSVIPKPGKKGVLVEKQSKKMRMQEQCKRKCYEKNGKAAVVKCITTETPRAHTVPKHIGTTVRKHKLKESRKLLKRGVKQKTVNTMKETVAVSTNEKTSLQIDTNMTVASSANVVHSRDSEDQPCQSARDKVNAIFRNSEFTRLHSSTSLVHLKRSKPALSCALSSSKPADGHSQNSTMSTVSPLKNGMMSLTASEHDMPKSLVTSGYLTGTASTSLSSSKRADVHSESFAMSTVSPLKNVSRVSRVDSERNISKSVVTSACRTGTALTSSSSSKPADGHSKNFATSTVSQLKNSSRMSRVDSEHDMPKSVVTSGYLTGTTLTSSSSSKPADGHSKNSAVSTVSQLKNSRMSRVESEQRDVPKSVVTSRCLTSTALNASVVCSTHKSMIRRPGGESTSMKTSTSVSYSVTAVKGKSGERNQVETSQISKTIVRDAIKLPSNSSLPVVCCTAVDRSAQNTIPSLMSLNFKPRTTADVSSVNHSITRSQSLNSTCASRDPRLAQRQNSVSSEQQMTFSLNEHSNAATSTVGANNAQNHCGAGQWPWEQTANAGILTRVSTSVGSRGDTRNELSSSMQSTAGCWMWELGEKTRTSSSHSSLLNVNVTDILSDLTTSSSAVDYFQTTDKSSQWHSASRVIHNGSLSSPPFQTANEDYRASDCGANTTFPCDAPASKEPQAERLKVSVESYGSRIVTFSENDYNSEGKVTSVRMSTDILSPVSEPDSLQYVPAANPYATWTSDPMESLSDPGWTLIPVDSPGISCVYNSFEKPLCERNRCSGFPSDPRLKDTSPSVNNSSQVDKSGVPWSTFQSNDTECQPIMAYWDTDSDAQMYDVLDVLQTKPTQQLDCSKSETSLTTAVSLDSRIGMFVSHMDTFHVDKNVDHVDRVMMSWWEEDLEDAETCFDNSMHSDELQQRLEGNDSDDHFIIIDSDDDNSNDRLVIDINGSDVEIMPEPGFNQSVDDDGMFKRVTGSTAKRDVIRNTEHVVTAETKTDRSILSDKDMQSVAKAKENRLGRRREHCLPSKSDSAVAGHQNRAVKHRNGKHERMKQNAFKRYDRAATSVSSHDYSVDSNCDDAMKLSQNKAAAARRKIYRYSSATTSTRNAYDVPSSSNTAKQSRESSVKKESVKTPLAGASATTFDSRSSASDCIASLADVSELELGKLKQHMETRVKAAEQKITESKEYACPLPNLSESEKRQLVSDRLAEPNIVSEFSIELRLQTVLRDIDSAKAVMAEIKGKFDPTRPSKSLEKKYDQYERACNILLVRRDWFYMRMNRMHRYDKSKCLLTLPDDMRFSSECGKFLSVEGIPLILNDCSLSLPHCTRLAALLKLIKSLRSSRVRQLPRDVVQKLGWLHQERRALLSEVCCSTAQKVSDSLECLSEKLSVYKYVTFAMKTKPFILQLLVLLYF